MNRPHLTLEIIRTRKEWVGAAIAQLETAGEPVSTPAIARITGLTEGQVDKVRYGVLDMREIELSDPNRTVRSDTKREPKSFRTCARCRNPITVHESWCYDGNEPVHLKPCKPVMGRRDSVRDSVRKNARKEKAQ